MKKPPAAGIPTAYKGIVFRSRLEATWAVFLDELKIEWRYEPFDLKGYIPDFALFDGKTLLEVKPVLDPHDFWSEVGKLERSGWTGRLFLVGAEFPVSRSCRLGLLGEAHAWKYADATQLGSTDALAVEAWKRAKNETKWFPGEAVKPPKRRVPKAPRTLLEREAEEQRVLRANRIKWLLGALDQKRNRDAYVAVEEAVASVEYRTTTTPQPTLALFVGDPRYVDVLIRDRVALLDAARVVSCGRAPEPITFETLVISFAGTETAYGREEV